ncbi:MAG: hypothetical protein A2V87_04850 [Deltaproteobacteria bacterium RBG_16_58_17]|nr:MAG: hypothetical protein A2V87_04850 [Deltaproteobacteria bacterium RBG_16_58_17]OHE21676.1 MAG: hypothetical protein A2X95_08290 [Syntrophobacterales bacterium GWF2_56_9]
MSSATGFGEYGPFGLLPPWEPSSRRRPGANAIVQFNPRNEKFISFPSDSRGANVRQLLGRTGEIWGGESGTDRLVVIFLKRK